MPRPARSPAPGWCSLPDGLRGWAEPEYARILIRRSALLRGRPVADVRALVEDLYQTTYPMDFAAVLASPVELHPLATDATTGESTDLYPLIRTPADLRLALRASAALPLLAGPAVTFAGRRFYDAGVSESVPYRTALTQGATHILVLRSRRAATPQPDPHANGSRPSRVSRMSRLLARTTLRRETPALRAAFLARESRLAADDQLLAEYEAASAPNSPAPPRPQTRHRPQPRPPCFPSAPRPAHPWSAASPPTAPCCKPPSSPGTPPP